MIKICLVTYLREGEIFTTELQQIANAFYEKYGNTFKAAVCCESFIEHKEYSYQFEQFLSHGTKYRRLISFMEQDDSDYYFSVDNDITGITENMVKLFDGVRTYDRDIGWGVIRAKKTSGLISNLVAVDKLLSHTIIRPMLWDLKCGISVPGQIFCIKATSYRDKLINLDTFLDDVALGLYVNVNKHKKYITKDILGYERPNSTFKGLWIQRSRWAIGYASILMGVKNNRTYSRLVRIHGLSYHTLWMLIYMILILMALYSWKLAVVALLAICLLIVREEPKKIGYALLYIFIFPIFHIRWGIVLVNELYKKGGN